VKVTLLEDGVVVDSDALDAGRQPQHAFVDRHSYTAPELHGALPVRAASGRVVEGLVSVLSAFGPGVDPGSVAPAGWHVRLQARDGSVLAQGVTGRDGMYRLTLPAGGGGGALAAPRTLSVYAGSVYLGGTDPGSNDVLAISETSPSVSVIDLHVLPVAGAFAVDGVVAGPAGAAVPAGLTVTVKAVYFDAAGRVVRQAAVTSHSFGAYRLLLGQGSGTSATGRLYPGNQPAPSGGFVKVTLLEDGVVVDSNALDAGRQPQHAFVDRHSYTAPELHG
jgi:hypothetical protein